MALKIIHIINNLAMGGAEKLMSTLLPELSKRGTEVCLICLNARHESAYLQPLLDAGIKVHFLSGNRSPYHPGHMLRLGKLLQQLRADVIHAHLFPTFYYGAIASRLFRIKAPLIMTEHDTSNRRIRSPYWKWIDRLIYRHYRLIICISDGVKEVIGQYMPSVQAKTIYNGVPLEVYTTPASSCHNATLFQLITQLKDHPANTLLVSVGRLVEKKNQQAMIRAMAQLPETCYLLLAGEGEKRAELEQLIAELQLTSRVFLLGNQSDIPYLVQHADIGLLSSSIEGFGLAAVEMMAAGLPVVCSAVPGLLEVAGHTSLLADPSEPSTFTRLVVRLMEDKAYYHEMAERCRQKAAQFSIHSMADNYLSAYHELLDRGVNAGLQK